jgi:hypothetical protein
MSDFKQEYAVKKIYSKMHLCIKNIVINQDEVQGEENVILDLLDHQQRRKALKGESRGLRSFENSREDHDKTSCLSIH